MFEISLTIQANISLGSSRLIMHQKYESKNMFVAINVFLKALFYFVIFSSY